VKLSGSIAIILIALFSVKQNKAEDNSFPVQPYTQKYSIQPHAQGANFCQVVFMFNGEEKRRTIDVREKFNIISNEILIPDSRTNFILTLDIAWIEKGANSFPREFKGSITLGAYNSTNETPHTQIGTGSWDINFDPENIASNIPPFSVVRSSLGENRSIYFCRIYLLVPVKPGLLNSDSPPEAIDVWMSYPSTLWHLWWGKDKWLSPKDTDQEGQTPSLSAKATFSDGTNTNNPNKKSPVVTANTKQSAVVFSNTVPVIGIVLKDGYVLVNSSPTVTNGTLEEASPASYPLVWQPAIESSNTPAGWQLPLKLGAKLFRLKLPDSKP